MRADLEDKLITANEALRLAENRAESLRDDLDRLNAAVTEGAGQTAAERAVDAIVAAALATATERENSRATVQHVDQTAAVRIEAAERRAQEITDAASAERASAEATSHDMAVAAKATHDSSGESTGKAQPEVQRLQGEVERARSAEVMAVKEAEAAKSRSSALEEEVEESKRIQALFRDRADSRLENLRLVVEEEEKEHGVQVNYDRKYVFDDSCDEYDAENALVGCVSVCGSIREAASDSWPSNKCPLQSMFFFFSQFRCICPTYRDLLRNKFGQLTIHSVRND